MKRRAAISRTLATSALLAGMYLVGTAQATPQFDLADVRVSAAEPTGATNPAMQGGVVREGVYRIQAATMVDLIRTAYGVGAEAVVGGPSWLQWDLFDIVARVPPSTSVEAARLMLQPLLAERFSLVVRADLSAKPIVVVDRVNRTPSENPPGVSALLPPPPPAAFEVASLRLSDPNGPEMRSAGPLPGGRFEVRGFNLRQLISMAWGIGGSELIGAPEWLNSVRVDVSAQLPSTDATREIVGVMDIGSFLPALKTLLIERFKVAIHTEQRPGSGYALVSVQPRLQRADPAARTKCTDGAGPTAILTRQVTCRNATLRQFAGQLQRLSRGAIRGQVLDATGIEGTYDITLSFSGPGVLNAQTAAAPATGQLQALDPGGGLTIFEALERQLGLRLEKRDIPVPVVVLDHIEPKPTDN